jgi:hypothetical protein
MGGGKALRVGMVREQVPHEGALARDAVEQGGRCRFAGRREWAEVCCRAART